MCFVKIYGIVKNYKELKMSSIDPVYLLKLLKVSEIFTESQKERIRKALPRLSIVALSELFDILEKEAKSKNKMLRKILEAKKEFAHKHTKNLYAYVEAQVEQEEEIELSLLDKELEALEV